VKILSLTLTMTLNLPIVFNTDMISIIEHKIQSHHNIVSLVSKYILNFHQKEHAATNKCQDIHLPTTLTCKCN
jgi:hypothetical protein